MIKKVERFQCWGTLALFISELIKLRAIEQYYGFLCFKYEAKSNWLGCQREIRSLLHPFAVTNESASQQGIAVLRSEFVFFNCSIYHLPNPTHLEWYRLLGPGGYEMFTLSRRACLVLVVKHSPSVGR